LGPETSPFSSAKIIKPISKSSLFGISLPSLNSFYDRIDSAKALVSLLISLCFSSPLFLSIFS